MINAELLGKLLDLGTSGLMIFVLIVAFREFKSVLLKLSDSWQTFLKENAEQNKVEISEIMEEVKQWAAEFVKLREDFNRAVTMMEERTRRTNAAARKGQ
jgi:hypothetical protein